MDGLFSFLSMGDYGAYVWPSYGLTLLVMGGLFLLSRKELRQNEKLLQTLRQKDADRVGQSGDEHREASQ